MANRNYLNLQQTSALLQVHPQTIYIWRKNDEFPAARRVGKRKLLWLQDDIFNWLNTRNCRFLQKIISIEF